mgnify:CR=1 FL=1
MRSAIATLAIYNKHADRLLHETLDRVDRELIERAAGSYFGSVLGLLNHILISHLTWLTRFREGGVPATALAEEALAFTHPGFGVNLYDDYEEVKRHQRLVDQELVTLVGELDAARGASAGPAPGTEPPRAWVVEYTNRRKETHRFAVADILLQLLNHATHHRGQISQILDENGVEHDWSGLFPVFEEQAE